MKNAHSSLPRVLNGAMMLTIPSFTLVVIVFYLCLPLDVIRTTTTLAMVSGFQF
jgi:hypothetical protein